MKTKRLQGLSIWALVFFWVSGLTLNTQSIYHSKSTWETQDGRKASLVNLSGSDGLRGSPVVVAMLYTSCQASCPLTLSDLNKIKNGLSHEEQKKVRFAVFSFDSDRDKPQHLKSFALKQGIDLLQWTFFHGSPSSVRELAALLGIRFKKVDGGDFDHSNIISILDPEGVIIHQQVGVRQNPAESINILRRLIEPLK